MNAFETSSISCENDYYHGLNDGDASGRSEAPEKEIRAQSSDRLQDLQV